MLLTKLRSLARTAGSAFAYVENAPEGSALFADSGSVNRSDAKLIEDATLRVHAVGAPESSGFTAFLEGIQRSDVRLYHGVVPIVYGYAAAVVRTRADRKLRTLEMHDVRYLTEREALFLPFRFTDPAALRSAGFDAYELIDTLPDEHDDAALFPPVLLARASGRVNRWREQIEADLGARWTREAEGTLLLDGALTLSRELAACKRAIGIVKQHTTSFFDGDDARLVLSLRAGERTSVFQPATRQFSPVYSWYLRLRDPAGRGVFWGLIRVEAAPLPESIERADTISRWLLDEAAPLALPDSRWDRLLYPLHECAQFLRSRAPVLR